MNENKGPIRELMLGETITTASAKELTMKIREINLYDAEQEKKLKDYKREPITLLINSYGGCIYSTVAIVTAIEGSITPIDTACTGIAASGAFWVYLAGRERYTHEMSTFMYHEVAHGVWWEKLEGWKKEVEEMDRMQNWYDSYVLKRTNILKSELQDYRTRKADWYMDGAEAKKRGVATLFFGESS
jgi:ATP-dependent Clp protease protease subunit